MARTDMIDSLIATYRTLNLTIRPMDPARVAQAGGSGGSIVELLRQARHDEITASQELKLMTLAEGVNMEVPEPPPSADLNNPKVLLSEFGTAREAILALVREMPEESWAEQRQGPNGTSSIQSVVERLLARDQQLVQTVQSALGSRS